MKLSLSALGYTFLKGAITLLIGVLIARLLLPFALDAKGDVLIYEKLPSQYLFLVFPKANCDQLKGINDTCPSRAVLVAKEELDSGLVQFSSTQETVKQIHTAALGYLPSANAVAMLRDWKSNLRLSGYSDGEWESKNTAPDQYAIKLTLHNYENARREQFVYFVNNGRVLEAKSLAVVGVFELLLLTVLFLVPAAFLWKIFGHRLEKLVKNMYKKWSSSS